MDAQLNQNHQAAQIYPTASAWERRRRRRRQQQQQQPITDQGIPLTFGIEVECYIVLDLDHLSVKPNSVISYLSRQFSNHSLSTVACYDPHFEALAYKTWTVTVDSSLRSQVGRDQSKKQGAVSDTDSDAESVSDYADARTPKSKGSGIELVSRPMPVPSVVSGTVPAKQPQMEDVGKYMNVLNGGSPQDPRLPHSAYTDQTCGLHVHLGRPSGDPFPLDILRHLAYLIVLYEPMISTLHPVHRRPYPGMQGQCFCDSNLTAFQIDLHNCYQFRTCFIPLDQVRKRIFNPALGLDGLAWLMGTTAPLHDNGQEKEIETEWSNLLRNYSGDSSRCSSGSSADDKQTHFCGDPDKYKIVNWQCLVRPDRPSTLEFRQAAGTLDPEEIAWTVQLYTALIREVERRAESGPGEFSFSETGFPSDLTMFLSMLRLPAEAIMYWTRRQVRLYHEAFLSGWREDNLTSEQVCSHCDLRYWFFDGDVPKSSSESDSGDKGSSSPYRAESCHSHESQQLDDA